jgi:hypothetical protein
MSLILSGTNGLSDVDGSAATPAIRGTDANTGIFFPAADTIAFAEGGAEIARFDSSGNFGIGTTSPLTKLEVSSATGSATPTPTEVRIATTGAASDWSTTLPWGRLSFYNADPSDAGPKIQGSIDAISDTAAGARMSMVFNTSAPTTGTLTERMRIDSSGNVGIGTSSPSSPLNVVSASSSLAIAINGRSSDNLGAMYFYANNGSTQYSTITASATEFRLSSVPAAAVQTFYTNGAERMRLTSDGNLQFNSGYGSVATAYGCRAWVNFNGTGTVAIRASGNVTSITDNGVGSYAVNLTTAMPDTNYAAVMATKASGGAGTPFLPVEHASLAARTTSSIAFYVIALNGATPDADTVEVVFFR